MTRYQRADPAALDELVRRISPPLLRYFGASRVGWNDAEDLLQDCWIRTRFFTTARRNECSPLIGVASASARSTRRPVKLSEPSKAWEGGRSMRCLITPGTCS